MASQSAAPHRRSLLALLLSLPLVAIAASPVHAHHGWGWVGPTQFVLTGIISKAELGNPHGRLMVDIDGEMWIVEVGQPWRNHRAGLKDEMLQAGTEIEASGHRSRQETEHRMKAERIRIDGKIYDLYPNRE